mgnify:CR=1 FL=1
MAFDQASCGSSGLLVQACGDAHLANLGMFAGPDRALVFDRGRVVAELSAENLSVENLLAAASARVGHAVPDHAVAQI